MADSLADRASRRDECHAASLWLVNEQALAFVGMAQKESDDAGLSRERETKFALDGTLWNT